MAGGLCLQPRLLRSREASAPEVTPSAQGPGPDQGFPSSESSGKASRTWRCPGGGGPASPVGGGPALPRGGDPASPGGGDPAPFPQASEGGEQPTRKKGLTLWPKSVTEAGAEQAGHETCASPLQGGEGRLGHAFQDSEGNRCWQCALSPRKLTMTSPRDDRHITESRGSPGLTSGPARVVSDQPERRRSGNGGPLLGDTLASSAGRRRRWLCWEGWAVGPGVGGTRPSPVAESPGDHSPREAVGGRFRDKTTGWAARTGVDSDPG